MLNICNTWKIEYFSLKVQSFPTAAAAVEKAEKWEDVRGPVSTAVNK